MTRNIRQITATWLVTLLLVGLVPILHVARAETEDVRLEEDVVLSDSGANSVPAESHESTDGNNPRRAPVEPPPPSSDRNEGNKESRHARKLEKKAALTPNCPASVCIPTGATFFTQLSAPTLPQPPVLPAPSARVLDNMTLTIKENGTWDLCFSMLVFERNGVAVNWKIVLWDKETGQPMYQFAPPPVRFSQPGYYKDRHITGQTCKCDGCVSCDDITCDRAFLDRSRSFVIVLPEDQRKHVYGFDAGCPDQAECASWGPNKSKCELRGKRGSGGDGGCGD